MLKEIEARAAHKNCPTLKDRRGRPRRGKPLFKAIGVTLPTSILLHADEVIE
jgi:hypothetical protein